MAMMTWQLLVFIIHLVPFNCIDNLASAICPQGDYRAGGECCPTCPPGKQVEHDCTATSITKCKMCNEGTFQKGRNGQKQCSTCTKCDAGLKVKKSCTGTSDALCEILDGYFCVDSNRGGCIAAQRHLACSPGQYISQRGTADKDTECLQCPDGTFSNGTSTSCQPHTECESVGLEPIQPGSDSIDTECGEHSSYIEIAAIVAGVTAGIILVIALKALGVWLRQKTEKTDDKEEIAPALNCPPKNTWEYAHPRWRNTGLILNQCCSSPGL